VLKGVLLGAALTMLAVATVLWIPHLVDLVRTAGAPLPTRTVAEPRALSDEQVKALFRTRQCTNCHKMDTTLVGPAVTAIADRYRGQPDAVAQLVSSLRGGSQGSWDAAMPMPAHPLERLSDAEAELLVRWVLAQ
jgi:cytochrome c551/c552